MHYDQQDKVIHDNAVSCSDNTSETTRTQSSYSFQTSKRSYDKDLEIYNEAIEMWGRQNERMSLKSELTTKL